jgi:hypothetical protein
VSKQAERDREVELLIAQRKAQVGEFAEYELRAIRGEAGLHEDVIYALGFSEQHFGMQFPQAVSCDTCGGLFVDQLDVARRHRLACGWPTPPADWQARLIRG